MAARQVSKANTGDITRANGSSLAQRVANAGILVEPESATRAVNLIAEELGRYLARSLRAERRKGYSLPEALMGAMLMAILAVFLWRRLSGH